MMRNLFMSIFLGFQDEQPDVQGLAVLISSERCATNSPIGNRLSALI